MTWLLKRSLFVVLLASGTGYAQMHPAEPTVNLGDTSFLDALGAPGFLLEEIGDGYKSGSTVDGTGHALGNAPAINSVSSLTHGVELTKDHLFGAWYGVEAILAAAHVNAGAPGAVGGFGDLTVSPLVLQWKQKKIGSTLLNRRFVLDFDVPVGEYRQNLPTNLSSHAFTVHPYYAFTFFPTHRIETSWRTHYLYNGVNNSPPAQTNARSTQAGQAVHFNATVAYALPHGIWLGANAYFLKQITAPKVNGAVLNASPEQIGSIGLGLVWDRGQYVFYANGYHELRRVLLQAGRNESGLRLLPRRRQKRVAKYRIQQDKAANACARPGRKKRRRRSSTPGDGAARGSCRRWRDRGLRPLCHGGATRGGLQNSTRLLQTRGVRPTVKPYLFSFALGCAVGVLYALFRVKSPAPPIVALLGLLGMVLGESGYTWFKSVVH